MNHPTALLSRQQIALTVRDALKADANKAWLGLTNSRTFVVQRLVSGEYRVAHGGEVAAGHRVLCEVTGASFAPDCARRMGRMLRTFVSYHL